jgi:hypothetical protein
MIALGKRPRHGGVDAITRAAQGWSAAQREPTLGDGCRATSMQQRMVIRHIERHASCHIG